MTKLFCFLFLFVGISVQAAPNIILVPGFFSSAVPAPSNSGNPWKQPYFSQDIVQHLSPKAHRLLVVDNLNPTGSVQENGEHLIQFLQRWIPELQDEGFVLLTHSAGGLYALYAAANSNLPIRHIITMSTPFRGLKLLENLEEQNIPLAEIFAPFRLDNLMGLTDAPVTKFLSEIQLKYPLKLDLFAGYQRPSIAVWDWRYLSTPLIPFQAIIGHSSDGIVTVQSSLDASALKTRNSKLLTMTVHENPFDLEHWEVILDASFSRAFGVQNISSLRRAQLQTYSEILRQTGY